MSDGFPPPPAPRNEPILAYAPGSPERSGLRARVREMEKETLEIPLQIGGREVKGEGTFTQVSPHNHSRELARVHTAGRGHIGLAIETAEAAAREWAATPFQERAAIFLKAADLITGPYRHTLNAATILGQSKSVYQTEIDAVCELADFLRFNVHFARRILEEQPDSPEGVWNRLDYRPLEGFILAITPFNFTAIAGNLPSAPALMGNVVVWKPSQKQALAAHYTMEIFRKAGLPDGVINLVNGPGPLTAEVCLAHESFAGLHFTGSSDVLRSMWRTTGENLQRYRNFPRIVGETGGKDFIVAHPSAELEPLAVAMVRGAFEYQGQKCSAASRAYIPQSMWARLRERVIAMTEELTMGDVGDLSTFMGAVIDGSAFRTHREAIEQARSDGAKVVVGGGTDDTDGWFVEPTILRTENPASDTMVRELFGPILTVYVYDDSSGADANWRSTLELVDGTSPYGLTGAVWARDRRAIRQAEELLRNAAGNFYINDKPTGAVVGQQPFGGARASGTNDKAGSIFNLLRWTSPRAIKETFVPAVDWRYPHMEE
ncbi:MAG: L-glutamate gamma-semialdehyde dehydrogenase [Gemmatimonadales bacterium]|nr:MAG: L-glutamate gamma-semialdehyde dehydrogenase [Gemmatimonadales bacterium]